MYDDWAYRDTYESSKPSGNISLPAGNANNRPRARSILQAVAHDIHASPPPPEQHNESTKSAAAFSKHRSYRHPPIANVPRRRAHSLANRSAGPALNAPVMSITYPFTSRENTQLLNDSECLEENDVLGDTHLFDMANDRKYGAFIDSATLTSYSCYKLLQETDQVKSVLKSLSQSLDFVKRESSTFEKASDKLMAEQSRLTKLAREIEEHMEIFNALDTATRILNIPGSDLVTRKQFKSILGDLDRGLEYTSKERDLKDIDLYAIRYKQCMTRALALVQEYVCRRLRDIASTAQKQLQQRKTSGATRFESSLNTTARSALLYARFENEHARIKEVSVYIAERTVKYPEYKELYSECIRTYLGIRYKLLSPIIASDLEEVVKDPRDLVAVSRTSLAFFRDIFTQERTLFGKFFAHGEFEDDSFQNWLVDLSEPLYDSLRQRIIRETDISILCELTSVLLLFDSEEGSHNGGTFNYEMGPLFKPILYDVQSRLVFRAQTIIEQDIVRYTPTTDDLTTISHRRSSKTTTDPRKSEFDPTELLEEWYPPMKISVTLLSQIYQLVNSAIFDDIAHRIVHECIISLEKMQVLAVKRLGTMESWLFMIRCYLMLRAQIIEFDIDHIPAELQVDFSGIQEVFAAVRREGINSTNFMDLARAGVPKVVSNMLDAKEELYAKLKNSIHQFTEAALETLIESITPDTSREFVKSAVEDTRKFRQTASNEFPRIRNVIELYIDDGRTIDILIDSIQDLVVQKYEDYFGLLLKSEYSSEDLEGVMAPDGFSSWLGDIVIKLHTFQEDDIADGASSISG